jgi:alpha-glucosidase
MINILGKIMKQQNDDWWRGSVTYQIYPRSFMDSNDDGVGDIRGITQKLDYLASLGVDAIWLSPIFTSPMKDMGYDVSDYTGVDPSFGTMEDFDDMITKAHKLGLKVIIDQVLSHSSDQHPHFQESKQSKTNDKSDWYVWANPNPDGTAPNNWQAIFGGIAWEWEPRRRQYYFHNFLKEQPDFNFHNREVQDYVLETMRFWLDRGVDGFRLDTVNFYFHDALLRDDAADYRVKSTQEVRPYDMQYHLFSKGQPENLDFLKRIRILMDEYDARTTVGEVGETHHAIQMMGDYTSDNRLHMAYSFNMLGPDFEAEHFRKQIIEFFEGAPEGWPCWALSNHDVQRHATRYQPHAVDLDSIAKLSGAILMSLEGSICLYQGEELGQVETEMEYHELTDPTAISFWPDDKGRDGCRTPMVWIQDAPNGGFSKADNTWLPVKAPQIARAADTQETDKNSVLNFYREMLTLRRARVDLQLGRSTFIDTPEPLLAFKRGENTLCVFNLSKKAQTMPLTQPIKPLIAQNTTSEDKVLKLGPNGFMIAKV